MDASLNIVELIENNTVLNLSPDYNNRFINKVKETFTETQQQLFVSSFGEEKVAAVSRLFFFSFMTTFDNFCPSASVRPNRKCTKRENRM